MGTTMPKYISYRIVVDRDDPKLCGRENCQAFVPRHGIWPDRCGAFAEDLENWAPVPPKVRRCDGCLGAKDL